MKCHRYLPRLKKALSYYKKPMEDIVHWLINSNETTNFTYNLTELNKEYLASFVSQVTNVESHRVEEYIGELENDEILKEHIEKRTLESPNRFIADRIARYGRRLGWYAFIRTKKPKIVIETGVYKGLGACVIASALIKNYDEGHKGYYYGIDINSDAGFLFDGKYKKFGEILYGDSVESLKKIHSQIDLFISDSDHSAEYEMGEYNALKGKLAKDAVIISDNAHVTNVLRTFAKETNRKFLFFQENPRSHWYPGAGIGVAFR